MSSIFARGNKLYAMVKDVTGKRRMLATGLSVGQDDEAKAWVLEREATVERALRAVGPHALTVERYANAWLDKRHTATVEDDRTRITLHVLPHIGGMMLVDVRPRHLRDMVEALKHGGKLAPGTILKTTGVVHTMFNSAVIDELIPSNPCVYERGVLPKKADKDPTWRAQAIYTRAEVERLLSSPLIPQDRRVLYALKFFAGRHKEVCRLTWSTYDTETQPLGMLQLSITKSGVPRQIPVHRTFAKVLAQWKLTGWEAMMGRKPKADDLIVPTRNLTRRAPKESQEQLVYDLEKLEMRTQAGERRFRRGHDLRRTFITLARADGANKDILRWVTHGPSSSDMMDIYASFDWSTLCAEVTKLRVELREGEVVKLASV